MKVQITAPAELDLDDIWQHVATESGNLENANHVLEGIGRRFKLFGHTPLAGKRRDDIVPGLRAFPAGNYLIYYRVNRGQVLILRVIHGSREQKAAFFEKSTTPAGSSELPS